MNGRKGSKVATAYDGVPRPVLGTTARGQLEYRTAMGSRRTPTEVTRGHALHPE